MPLYGIRPGAKSFTEIPVLLPLLLCCAALLCGGCAGKGGADFREDSGAPRFVLPGGVPAGEADILGLVRDADYILVGEHHDNPADHKAQAGLMALLAQKGGQRPLIGLEMLPRRYYDFQLAAFNDGRISLVDLPEALNWKNTWGYDFALYRPIFETAREYGLKLYGLNLPDAVRRSVGRNGVAGLSEAEKSELPGRIILPQPEQKEKLLAVFRMHSAMSAKKTAAPAPGAPGEKEQPALSAALRKAPDKREKPGRPAGGPAEEELGPAARSMFDRFILIQSLWDSTMAERAVEIRKPARPPGENPAASGPPMVILAGAGHVEYGYGIASRLRLFDPGARIVLVMPFSGENPDPEMADLYYYSKPRAHSPYGFTFTQSRGGLRIVNVAPGSRAETAGMRAGDTISRANDAPVLFPADLHKAAVKAGRQGTPLRFTLDRGGKTVRAVIPRAG